MDVKELGDSIVESTRGFVSRSLHPILARLTALELKAQATTDVEKRIRALASRIAALEKTQ